MSAAVELEKLARGSEWWILYGAGLVAILAVPSGVTYLILTAYKTPVALAAFVSGVMGALAATSLFLGLSLREQAALRRQLSGSAAGDLERNKALEDAHELSRQLTSDRDKQIAQAQVLQARVLELERSLKDEQLSTQRALHSPALDPVLDAPGNSGTTPVTAVITNHGTGPAEDVKLWFEYGSSSSRGRLPPDPTKSYYFGVIESKGNRRHVAGTLSTLGNPTWIEATIEYTDLFGRARDKRTRVEIPP